MSLASNRVVNAKQFKDRIYSLKMPASDKVGSTPLKADSYPVAKEVIQDYFDYFVPQTGVAWGSQVTFRIPRSVGRIYDLFMQIDLPADSVTYCPYTAAKIINRYQLNIGNNLIDCSGSSMFFNRQQNLEIHGRDFFSDAAGGSAGGSPSTSLFIMLDYPGSYSVSIPGAANTHEQSYSIPFPLNKCNNDMIITVTLPTAAEASVGTAPTGVPSFRLWYQTVWSSDDDENRLNNNGLQEEIFMPGYYLTNYDNDITFGTAETGINISSGLQDGQILNILVQGQSAAQITAKNYYAGLSFNTLRLNVNGVDFFKTYSASETEFRQGLGTRQKPFEDGALDAKVYNIWGTTDPFLIGSDEYLGLNLYRNNPTLYVSTATAIGAGKLNVTSVTKVVYIIDKFGMVNKFWASF